MGELERRFTEFQVVETVDGKVIAVLGLQIQGNQGHVHSEGYHLPEHTELLRDVLWERVKKVAVNHGLVRVWTGLEHGYWKKAQFREPQAEELTKRPAPFGEATREWRVLQLKEEVAQPVSLEQELAIFREAQKAETAAFHERAKFMKMLALLISLAVAAFVGVGIYYYWPYISRQRGGLGPDGGIESAPAVQEQKGPVQNKPVTPTNAPANPTPAGPKPKAAG